MCSAERERERERRAFVFFLRRCVSPPLLNYAHHEEEHMHTAAEMSVARLLPLPPLLSVRSPIASHRPERRHVKVRATLALGLWGDHRPAQWPKAKRVSPNCLAVPQPLRASRAVSAPPSLLRHSPNRAATAALFP